MIDYKLRKFVFKWISDYFFKIELYPFYYIFKWYIVYSEFKEKSAILVEIENYELKKLLIKVFSNRGE